MVIFVPLLAAWLLLNREARRRDWGYVGLTPARLAAAMRAARLHSAVITAAFAKFGCSMVEAGETTKRFARAAHLPVSALRRGRS